MKTNPPSRHPERRSSAESRLVKELTDIKFALDQAAIIVTTDQHGRITYVNDKYCQISRYSREELVGQVHRMVDAGYHSEEFIRNIWDTIENGEVWHGELRHRAKDGSVYWVNTTVVPFLDESGRPFQYISILTDVTERKLVEERMRQQASLLDHAQDAILVCDLNLKILYWNSGAERIYGYTVDEVLGREIDDVFRAEEAFRPDIDKADSWNGEFVHRTRSGDLVNIMSRWTLVRNERGQPDYFLISNTDVTEQRKSEMHLFRAQRMESIGTLAGGVAHDLNNVLSPIMMSVDMLQLRNPAPEAEKWLRMIRESAERGAELIKQVLTFARGFGGERISLQVRHIVKELISVLGQTLPKNIEVKFDVASNLSLVSADPTHLHQILMNLCINARDAMPAGGTLQINAENADVDAQMASLYPDAIPGKYVRIDIVDTGTGIEKDVLARIFDPFFTTKDIGKGTGLGLSTTLMIVKGHGGFLNVYSEVGKGSRFSIYLPAVLTGGEKAAEEDEADLPTGSGQLVLVVDDEEPIREVARATLEGYGYRVLTAANGAEARKLFEERRDEIDLILTDMAMPVMGGAELIAVVKATDPSQRIVAMSGMMDQTQSDEIEAAGVAILMPKPFTAEKLLKAVDQGLKA
jgi:two-component system, cell cycle sensor histidine kinase and response regulator CckA